MLCFNARGVECSWHVVVAPFKGMLILCSQKYGGSRSENHDASFSSIPKEIYIIELEHHLLNLTLGRIDLVHMMDRAG